MLKIAVAEDEIHTYDQIHGYIDRYAEENHLSINVTYYSNGYDISDNYVPQYDIILMDVDMPIVNGISAAHAIRELDPQVIIIFITNLSQYAIQGYSVQAFDYILKPLAYFPFAQFFGRAISKVNSLRSVSYHTIKLKDSIHKLAIADIYYIEIQNHTLFYHTASGIYQVTGKLKDIESQLSEYDFSRCSSGYLVNLEHVDSIQENDTSVHGDILPISRSRKKEFSSALLNYISSSIK